MFCLFLFNLILKEYLIYFDEASSYGLSSVLSAKSTKSKFWTHPTKLAEGATVDIVAGATWRLKKAMTEEKKCGRG